MWNISVVKNSHCARHSVEININYQLHRTRLDLQQQLVYGKKLLWESRQNKTQDDTLNRTDFSCYYISLSHNNIFLKFIYTVEVKPMNSPVSPSRVLPCAAVPRPP